MPLLQVDAYPPVVSFSWFFNNSDHKEAVSEERFKSEGLVSTLDFSPASLKDYGTLFCAAQNVIGRQETPCVYKIMPTGQSPLSLKAKMH